MKNFGYLRESEAYADANRDKQDFPITGLDTYLAEIFPDIHDWKHDKALGEKQGTKYRIRPDYLSEELKIIVEFDGLLHYTGVKAIRNDRKNTQIYKELGYKVVRIPYFIQLTNSAIETLFCVKMKESLFPDGKPSLTSEKIYPASLCPLGIKRMKEEFLCFQDQFDINIKYLESIGDNELTGVEYLKANSI